MPIGTGELRKIHSRVSWMFLPVERSITVSAPQRVAQVIFSTSSSIVEVTAELPMLALIFTRKLRPMIIGSLSGWLMFDGMIARPRATSSRTNCRLDALADRDELHLRRDLTAPRVVHLRHVRAGFRAANARAFAKRKSEVDRVEYLGIAARLDPAFA